MGRYNHGTEFKKSGHNNAKLKSDAAPDGPLVAGRVGGVCSPALALVREGHHGGHGVRDQLLEVGDLVHDGGVGRVVEVALLVGVG